MKKITLISLTVILIIGILTTISDATFTANINMEGNLKTIEIGETKTLIVSVNEPVYALSFKINYDSQVFELVGSETDYLNVSEANGKIACIYADSTGTGTTEFKIKFKAIQETTNGANFSIENAKFSTIEQEESYTGNQITGLEQPLTLKVVNSEIKTIYSSEIIKGQNILGIMFKNSYTDATITKSTFMRWTDDVGNLYDAQGNLKSNDDIIKTGDKIEVGKETFSVVLYGDANGDGIVCDADDIMIIIDDFLGRTQSTGKNRVAANLENRDDMLDTDDLAQMINRFLGRLKNTLVTSIPESTLNPYESDISLNNDIEVSVSTYVQGWGSGWKEVELDFQNQSNNVNTRTLIYFEMPNENFELNGHDMTCANTWLELGCDGDMQFEELDPVYGYLKKKNDDQSTSYERNYTYKLGTDGNTEIKDEYKIKYKLYDTVNDVFSNEKQISIKEYCP